MAASDKTHASPGTLRVPLSLRGLIKPTPNGVAFTLKTYIYAEPHGYLAATGVDSRGRNISHPTTLPGLIAVYAGLVEMAHSQAQMNARRKRKERAETVLVQ
jgi:hypothetical protein